MKYLPEQQFMKKAIAEAYKGIKQNDGGPFGACIVKDDRVVAIAHNTVLRDNDPTAHSEINAIRLVSKKLNTYDLSDCIIYSTTEPCPMCFSAIHWAKIKHIICGTSIKDVAKRGFNELLISDKKLCSLGKIEITILEKFMRKECLELLEYWDKLSDKKVY